MAGRLQDEMVRVRKRVYGIMHNNKKMYKKVKDERQGLYGQVEQQHKVEEKYIEEIAMDKKAGWRVNDRMERKGQD